MTVPARTDQRSPPPGALGPLRGALGIATQCPRGSVDRQAAAALDKPLTASAHYLYLAPCGCLAPAQRRPQPADAGPSLVLARPPPSDREPSSRPSQPRMRGHALPSLGQKLDRFWIDFWSTGTKSANSADSGPLRHYSYHFTTSEVAHRVVHSSLPDCCRITAAELPARRNCESWRATRLARR